MSKLPDIDPSWYAVLKDEFSKEYMTFIRKYLQDKQKEGRHIYPENKNILRAFNETPFDKVKVVIVGQDPYHGPLQANGLCFSVDVGLTVPPSLANIFKELVSDIGCEKPITGDLTKWAQQGVLLLNSVLTVEIGKPGSHQMLNWENFTDTAISALSSHRQNIVFILWGAFAVSKSKLIDHSKHLVITSAHPSPLSSYRGFFGSRPFSQANDYLIKSGNSPIIWNL